MELLRGSWSCFRQNSSSHKFPHFSRKICLIKNIFYLLLPSQYLWQKSYHCIADDISVSVWMISKLSQSASSFVHICSRLFCHFFVTSTKNRWNIKTSLENDIIFVPLSISASLCLNFQHLCFIIIKFKSRISYSIAVSWVFECLFFV